MKRKYTKPGDILSVQIDDGRKKYMQYIISDLTQLNSDVIRAFKEVYSISQNPELTDIIKGEIDFYAHCVTKAGIKMGLWDLVGNISDVGDTENILFRSSEDYGNPEIKISQDWWVWNINMEASKVGKLKGENRRAEIGCVVTPKAIVDRMQTGKYNFKYPDFE
jgi:hypothetical protein